MSDQDKIIEVMASGICGPGTPCEACRNSAERALSTLHAKGLAVVPVEDMRHMREVLDDLLADMPDPLCEHLHHPFKDRHTYDEDCPVVERLLVAIAKAKAMLAASNSPKEESDE